MTRIAVVAVPFIKTDFHLGLIDQFLASVSSSHTVDTIAIANSVRSNQDIRWLRDRFSIVEHNDRNILALAWNRGIRLALERGAELVVVCNLDIILHPLCLDNLLECSRQKPEALVWSPIRWHDRSTLLCAELLPLYKPTVSWSCFAVNRFFFETVGEFDEAYIPAYREDSDMAYRMMLAGRQGISCHAALFHDFNRGTIKGLFNCPENEINETASFLFRLRVSITANDKYYAAKWGGIDGAERFSIPFNGLRPKD